MFSFFPSSCVLLSLFFFSSDYNKRPRRWREKLGPRFILKKFEILVWFRAPTLNKEKFFVFSWAIHFPSRQPWHNEPKKERKTRNEIESGRGGQQTEKLVNKISSDLHFEEIFVLWVFVMKTPKVYNCGRQNKKSITDISEYFASFEGGRKRRVKITKKACLGRDVVLVESKLVEGRRKLQARQFYFDKEKQKI